MQIQFNLNGNFETFDIHPGTLLSELLRQQGRMGPDSGCGALLLDGRLIDSFITLAAQAQGRKVLTIEGVRHVAAEPTLTGCATAATLSSYALLQENPQADAAAIAECLSGTLCRCQQVAQPEEAPEVVATQGNPALPGSRA